MSSTSPDQEPRKWMPPFFTIWGGQAISLLGSQLVQFALIWWLTETSGSATVLATATLVALLPQVFLAPLAGALVDRWNRRVVIDCSQPASAGVVMADSALLVLRVRFRRACGLMAGIAA